MLKASEYLDLLECKFKDRPNLKEFFDFAANLPPSLEYRVIEYTRPSSKKIAQLRDKFGKPSRKRTMYRWFAKNYQAELLLMNVPKAEIDRMLETGYRPRGPNRETLDLTIDHMHSFWLGGKEVLLNHCMLPDLYNHFKNVLERLQVNDREVLHERLIMTIGPREKNGRINRVPYIEGGFKCKINNDGGKAGPRTD